MSLVLKCPVCQTIVQEGILAKVNGYTVHQCPSCHLRFSNPMRHPGAEWYRESAHYKQVVITKSLPVPLWVIRRDWRFRTFLTLKPRPGGKLLEVGCGTGHFLRLARAEGYQVVGIDVDDMAIKVARDRFGLLETYVLSVEEFLSRPWEGRFDVICLFDVLEHLDNPITTARGLRRGLVPGGYLELTVPGCRRWPGLFHPHLDFPPNHLTLWTPQAVEKCISNAGFMLVKVRRSPLRGGNLWPYALSRFGVLERLGILGSLVTEAGYPLVAAALAKVLSIIPGAGGFTLMGVAIRSLENP